MRNFTMLILLLPLVSYCQNEQIQTNPISTATLISKWQKAVVNLEARKEAYENLELNSKINSLEEAQLITGQFTGTAIFLKHKGKRYLITARHVLFDAEAIAQKHKHNIIDSVNDQYSVFLKFFKIPTEVELEDSSLPEMPLALLGVPSYFKANYVFSIPEQDLAIISLDGNSRFSIFADLLEKK